MIDDDDDADDDDDCDDMILLIYCLKVVGAQRGSVLNYAQRQYSLCQGPLLIGFSRCARLGSLCS